MKISIIIILIISFSIILAIVNNKDYNIDSNKLSTSFYDYIATTIDGNEIQLSKYKGKKIIIVNVASKCGYTPQYEALEELYNKYKNEIEILAFPSNDSLWQEPGKNSDIKEFTYKKAWIRFKNINRKIFKEKKIIFIARLKIEWNKSSKIQFFFSKKN